MGYIEISHTADYAIRVWGPDLTTLLAEAARGMNKLAGVEFGSHPRVSRQVALQGPDAESLLTAFLSELIFLQEQEQLAFDEFSMIVAGLQLAGQMSGAAIHSLLHPIKAVTFHKLRIVPSSRGLETTIVFDV